MIRAVVFDMYETLISQYRVPLYFGEQIAADMGVPRPAFKKTWDPTGFERSVGKLSLEELLERILRENGIYSPELLERIAEKRTDTKREQFRNMSIDVLTVLDALRCRGLRLGLISNCYSEEVAPIRESLLAPYFDKLCLSYELGMKKPEPAVFRQCISGLGVRPEECIYIADGLDGELYAARDVGMRVCQAGWYIRESGQYRDKRDENFPLLESPFGLLAAVDAEDA